MNNYDYNDAMISAFIGKEEKSLWYQLSFEKYSINGIDNIQWNWSWWAFGGGFLFLLYRKQYLASLVLFLLSMTIGMIPFGGFILAILAGGYSTYFVYKGYKSKLIQVEDAIANEQKRIQTMQELGGYHQWVVWVYGVLAFFFMLGISTMVLSLSVPL